MSTKDYIKFAAEVSKIADDKARRAACQLIANVCAADNPRFCAARFYAACNVRSTN